MSCFSLCFSTSFFSLLFPFPSLFSSSSTNMRVLDVNGTRYCDFRVQVYDCEGSDVYYKMHLAGFVIILVVNFLQILLLLYRVCASPAPLSHPCHPCHPCHPLSHSMFYL